MKSPPRPKPPVVLLIEDTPSLQVIYRTVLSSAGYIVRLAGTAAEGMAAFVADPAQVVLLDLGLPDRDGLELIHDMLALRAETKIIVITANASINRAVDAMRAGAHEFLVKPFAEGRFLSAVSQALDMPVPRSTPAQAPAPLAERDAARPFQGSSEVMARIHGKINSVAKSMATVFITGESGTGKELCALAVHAGSGRATGPFIALNCGAIPHDLLESEVFGHVKGSFTGAITDRPGAATAADGGTLFLDEICEMAPALQTKLLRFLQTSTVLPVGANRPQKVNVRIICATNRDPLDAVRRGHFREDLYYRLFVVPIHMPPLRDRGNDVIEIAESALQQFAQEEGRHFDGLSREVIDLFRRLPWPGNVRQVLNVMRNIVVLNPGGLVTLAMLPDNLGETSELLPPPGVP
ncbi:MAG: sigma-54-dependent Fis family transcriptional regulator, partial [Candidatus Saccharibacteria bacterium]|nr:sigma-54-dependent Fis family transcriptional regulator [Pseudorhodobacter sp.]